MGERGLLVKVHKWIDDRHFAPVICLGRIRSARAVGERRDILCLCWLLNKDGGEVCLDW